MKIGIVGSRRRKDRLSVALFVRTLEAHDVVVTGGCAGVDTWAEEAARQAHLRLLVFLPNLSGCKHRGDCVEAYYARNRQIAKASDVVVAFVAADRTGGTENTIKHAEQLGIPHVLVAPNHTITKTRLIEAMRNQRRKK